MKKFLATLIIGYTLTMAAFAQKVSVQESNQAVGDIPCKGMATLIELEPKTVEKAWAKKLKGYGKTESSRDVYLVNVALVPEVSLSAVKVYSRLISNTKGTIVFFAIEQGDEFLTPDKAEYEAARRILHDFAVTLYREDMNEQIKEAERAVATTVRSYERKTQEGKNLEHKLTKNEEEKKKLEQMLIDNAEEHKRLLQEIAQNKLQQEATFDEIGKVRKVAELKKVKLTEIQ
jgi:hypothetical protein